MAVQWMRRRGGGGGGALGSSRTSGCVDEGARVRRTGFHGERQGVTEARRKWRRRCRAVKTRAETAAVFSEGMRVKVTEDVVVFHAPGSAKTGLNIKGFEGVVVRIADNHKGIPISSTHVVKVELTLQTGDKLKKFLTHFKEHEIEAL